MSGSTPYDALAYPTAIFSRTHPDRLAARARLHGITAADPAIARVLEVGSGDAMNLLAMAVAAPEGTFVGFDLAPTVIERGRRRAEAAGLNNVRLEVRDLVEAADGLEGQFDYIIAHGLYAWVPEAVRKSLFTLIARVLAPNGIAFISYNTLPGGHFRMAVRDLMRHFIPADADPATMLRTARAVLEQFVEPQSGDGPDMIAFRDQASRTLKQPDGLLFHDELGPYYHPQLHSAVCDEARRAGLLFLGDASSRRLDDAFLPDGLAAEDDVHAQIARLAQERDFVELRYFRRSLFVRAETQPARTLESSRARSLWASSHCERKADAWQTGDGAEFTIGDEALNRALDRLAEQRPGRVAIDSLGLDDQRLGSLLRLFDLGALDVHASPEPFATSAPERPLVSPLARAMIAEGLESVCSLDHSSVRIEDSALRGFLAGMDGSRGPADLEALAIESGFADPGQWRAALEIALTRALVMPDNS